MKPKALFIGSIGAVAETSEIQRQAYNQALKENNVNWQWDKDTYKNLLKSNGGQDRLEMLGQATGQQLSQEQINKIHARKTELAGEQIKNQKVQPRAGLAQLITEARENGAKVAWVTTTGQENTDAILSAFDGKITKDHFDHIFHRDAVQNGKPSPDIYNAATKHFNLQPQDCIAIEDSMNSTLAAKGAGIYTVTTLGDYHNEQVEKITDCKLNSLSETSWSQLENQWSKTVA
ncbi:MAG: HAD-IA family hydrolase [Nonlabens sp.]